jgi:hypothetical protein
VDRRGFLRGRQAGEAAEEGVESARHPRDARIERAVGAVGIAAKRGDEGADANGGAVTALSERGEGRQGARAIARDRLAQRQPAARFIGFRTGQRERVVGLRQRLLAEEIARQAAVGGEARYRRAEPGGAVEFSKRVARLAHRDQRRAHSRLGRRRARPDVGGAAEKADCRFGIAGIERGTAGTDQRLIVARGLGEDTDVAC